MTLAQALTVLYLLVGDALAPSPALRDQEQPQAVTAEQSDTEKTEREDDDEP